jgi:hypothetical protein
LIFCDLNCGLPCRLLSLPFGRGHWVARLSRVC